MAERQEGNGRRDATRPTSRRVLRRVVCNAGKPKAPEDLRVSGRLGGNALNLELAAGRNKPATRVRSKPSGR
jgi:hypothetical protein